LLAALAVRDLELLVPVVEIPEGFNGDPFGIRHGSDAVDE